MLLQVDHSKKIDLGVTMVVEAKKDHKLLVLVMVDNQMKNPCSLKRSSLIQRHLMKANKDRGEMLQKLLKTFRTKLSRRYQHLLKPMNTSLTPSMTLFRPSQSKAISSEGHDQVDLSTKKSVLIQT